jgi:hypothetical protein
VILLWAKNLTIIASKICGNIRKSQLILDV